MALGSAVLTCDEALRLAKEHSWASPASPPASASPSVSRVDSASEASSGFRADGFFDFERRGKVWELKRLERLENLRRLKELQELSQCSFQPKLAAPKAACEAEADAPKPLSPFSSSALAARLCQPLPSEHMRSFHLRRLHDSLEEQRMSECTFQPNLSKSTFWLSLSRLRHEAEDEPKRTRSAPRQPRPRTNSVPLSMTRAQSYLAQDVFHRLDRGGSVAARSKRSKSEDSGLRLPAAGTACNPTTAFLGFLERQNHCEDLRRQRLEQIASEMEKPAAAAAQAKICKGSKSRQLSRQLESKRGRAGRAGEEEPKPVGRGESGEKEAEWSFRPKILEISQKRQPRGCRELSSGDSERQKRRLEELREDLLQTQEVSYFMPKLNASETPGRLCVLDEPETYTARLAADRDKSLALRERELQQRIDEALAECTFRPAVNPGPPKYITRMAESHRALKELRLGLASREERGGSLTLRPDWR
ncbi:hypothetical protein AK812_SmicGene24201 [Symbiodinium microadriaticum]|uniref:Uncharacterized protein n=1 Tax=Symbiodinium microadriaticum TaxID=2951 RepID=A0A1Q9DFB7_SYMMI|nr:hypothetical protein AK812_SmicGene24201 [Symbiodinium microadriaticum]CAE7884765.1 unnamed protein product [Symbiodinium microadriaticum]CAE7948199.1 unnamed protein product [Symbiodinium sp. KB8]